MKPIYAFVFIFLGLFIFNTISIAQSVSVETFPLDPQSGSHNYFGVRVTLSQGYNQDVTVQGYIYDEGNGFNSNHPFTLTISVGNLSAETSATFYETDPTANAVAEISSATLVVSYAGVNITYEINNHILKFNSADDVNTVLNQMDADYETYNTNYVNQYPNLTEDQLDDMDDQTGFDEFTTFKNFEAQFSGFISKRSQIEVTENTWLSNDLSGTDPDDIDYTFDDAENTIFNDSYQLKIGDDAYEMRSDGLYNLSNGNLTMLTPYSNLAANQLNIVNDQMGFNEFALFKSFEAPLSRFVSKQNDELLNDFSYPDGSSYTFSIAKPSSEQNSFYSITNDVCITNVKRKQPFPYGSDRQFELKAAVHSSFIRTSAKGKVVSLKKKNGHWKRNRSNMAVGCAGNIYEKTANIACSLLYSNLYRRKPTNGYDKKKSLKTIERHAGPGAFKVKTNEFYAFFELSDGTYHQLYVY
jgi:hypothetical protein